MPLSCKGGDAYVTVFPLQFLLQPYRVTRKQATKGDFHEKIFSPAGPYCRTGRNRNFYCFEKEKEI